MPYCKPRDTTTAGISEVKRRLALLLNCLAKQINVAVVNGTINDDLHAFNRHLRRNLEAEGWTFSYDGGPNLKVREPGHKRPFLNRSS